MRICKPLQLTGYAVNGTDQRTGTTFEDFIVLDKETMRGVEAMGMNVVDAVAQVYSTKGYTVHLITREHSCTVKLDLLHLFAAEQLPTTISNT